MIRKARHLPFGQRDGHEEAVRKALGTAEANRPLADDILRAVSAAYNRPPERVPERSCQPAFRSWVYLLRRAANLRLKEVARLAGILAPRVSQIQREIEQGEVDSELGQLLETYQLKL